MISRDDLLICPYGVNEDGVVIFKRIALALESRGRKGVVSLRKTSFAPDPMPPCPDDWDDTAANEQGNMGD